MTEISHHIENQEWAHEPLLSSLPHADTHDTSVHELYHACVVRERGIGKVDQISVQRDGPILGWTLVTLPDPAVAAAGVVHGSGDWGDRQFIFYDAIERGVNPYTALALAVHEARSAIEALDDRVIDYAARGLSYKKHMTGSQLDGLFRQAEYEVTLLDENKTSLADEDVDWLNEVMAPLGETQTDESFIDPDDDSREEDSDDFTQNIPEKGMAILTVHEEEVIRMIVYADGLEVASSVISEQTASKDEWLRDTAWSLPDVTEQKEHITIFREVS